MVGFLARRFFGYFADGDSMIALFVIVLIAGILTVQYYELQRYYLAVYLTYFAGIFSMGAIGRLYDKMQREFE